jgi:SPP1 gp7 family putative phage head morphogenesis protein
VGAGKEAAVRRTVEQALKEAFVVGQQTGAREVERLPTGVTTFSEGQRAMFAQIQRGGLIGSLAQQFFKNRALTIAGKLTADIIWRAQTILTNALKGDKTNTQVEYDLHQALGEWMPERDAANRILNVPARIETIARTSIGEAMEEGRWSAFTDPSLEGFVTELQYSAVMDSRTRDRHRAWDGVTLPPDHPAWHTPTDNRPKNGFNCRCTLVPISAADDVPQTPDAEIPREPAADPGFK